MTKPEPIELTEGTGPLGAAGLWRGGIYYTGGSCAGNGFFATLSFSQSGIDLIGSVSARPTPRDWTAPLWSGGYLGHISGTVAGFSLPPGEGAPDHTVSATFSGGVSGQFDGTLSVQAGHTVWQGMFTNARPCVDETGPNTWGVFTFTSDRVVNP